MQESSSNNCIQLSTFRLYRLLVYFYDKWVFMITDEPGIVVDPAYPPTYIIVEENMEVRFSTVDEAIEIYKIKQM